MYICKIGIEHRGCWGPDLTREYNSLFMTFFCVENSRENVLNSIVKMHSSNEKHICDIVESMNLSGSILKIAEINVLGNSSLLQKSNDNLLFFVRSKKPEILPLIKKHDLIPIPPVRVAHGIEEWTLLSNNKENFNKFYNSLKNTMNVRIKSFKDFSLDFNLDINFDPESAALITNKQKEILQLFYKEGYYDWPRKVTVKEVTEKLHLCRSTIQEHIRKAESRLMSSFIKKFVE